MTFARAYTAYLVAYSLALPLHAQSSQKPMVGEYYLTGVREVGSGIKLNADSTFEFFFAYGALDRFGKGTWKFHENQLLLNSAARPPKDFALVTSRKEPGDGLMIRIVDPNKQLLHYVDCAIKNGTDIQQKETNAEGLARFSEPGAEAISLRFQLCPDRYSVFTIDKGEHNYFEFRFEPWIAEVFFDHVGYRLVDGNLEGPLPLLEPGKTYSFVRE
ncbi:hypothetical protein WBJ53_01810 [Spirosoma sp. SC4-14]|uniref:hypothetical protein n=1 Tax=Spirosoma sp. SC4-14 TaxID=3128900 RepID=UPI0030D3CFF7